MSRTNEAQIQFHILKLMQTGSEFSNAQLKDLLRQEVQLSSADRVRSRTRHNEAKWENLVNNALGRERSNSLYKQGAVENCGHGLHRITEQGIAILRNQERLHEAFSGAFGDLGDEWR